MHARKKTKPFYATTNQGRHCIPENYIAISKLLRVRSLDAIANTIGFVDNANNDVAK